MGVALATTGAIAFGFTYADQAALLPLLSGELGLTDVQAGLLSTALFVSYFVATLFTTGFPDRLGPKPVIAAGLAGAAIGTAVFATGTSFPVLLIAKAIQGFGSALAFVASARFIAGLYGEEQPHFGLGLYGGGFPLGSALALLSTPTIAGAFGGWRGSFTLEAAALGAILVLWIVFAPSVPAVRRVGNMIDALPCANCWLPRLQHAARFWIAGAAVLGVGVGLPYAAVFNTAAASLPSAPGAAQGLAAIGGTAGVMIGAPLMGFAVQTWGFAAAWLVVGLVGVGALVGTFAMFGEEELSPARV